MSLGMKRSSHLRSSSNSNSSSSSKTELRQIEPELLRLGRTLNTALFVPVKRQLESSQKPMTLTNKSVKRNCSAKTLAKPELPCENETPNLLRPRCLVVKPKELPSSVWKRLAQRKMNWFVRHLSIHKLGGAKALEHRRVRVLLSCLQEWKSLAQRTRQERSLTHDAIDQIAELDSLLETFRLDDRFNSSFEIKRQRAQSPSYFQRTSRKLSLSRTSLSCLNASEAKADAFRRRACLYYYGTLPLKKFLTSTFVRREHKAKVEAARTKLKVKAVNKWLEFYISRYEEVYRPSQHYHAALSRRTLNAWRDVSVHSPERGCDGHLKSVSGLAISEVDSSCILSIEVHSNDCSSQILPTFYNEGACAPSMDAAAAEFFKVKCMQLSFGARVFDAWRSLTAKEVQ